MGVKNWLGFQTQEKEVSLDDYLEGVGLHNGELLDESRYTYVKSISVANPDVLGDVEKELRKGNIIIVDIDSAQANKLALKKIIDDLKALCEELDGDMGRVSASKILFVPNGFRILKRKLT